MKHGIDIFAEEVRQYIYCQRIVYWRRVAHISGTPTYLMNTGASYHQRRQQRRYNRKNDLITHKNRLFFHNQLRFGGKLDVCREQEDQIIAVEYKRFYHRAQPSHSHIIQAIVGGMAAEYELDKRLDSIEIQYYQGRRIGITIDQDIRDQTLSTIAKIREMIVSSRLPKPTDDENKCNECEFYKVCHGV